MIISRLELKPEPDGFGFLYGHYIAADSTSYRIDVLPSAAEWRGDFKTVEPDTKAWIVFADGNEIARVISRDDLEPMLRTALPSPS